MTPKKQQLKNYLMSILTDASSGSGGKEIICKCHECGRLKLYLGPFDDTNDIVLYNCYRCKTSGVVDQRFLDEYGVSAIDTEILSYNKGNPYKCKGLDKDVFYNLNNGFISDSKLSRYKLNYINQRLGTNFTYQDCLRNKIVLNAFDLFNYNHINKYTRPDNIMSQLNDTYIGFLSRANSSLNMRMVLKNDMDMRYVNYSIFSTTANNDYYIIPCEIDLTRHVKIYIAEGPFDILSIKYNVIQDEDNCIYLSGKGKAYDNALHWLITTYGLYDFEVHYFPDKDVDDRFIMNIVRKYQSILDADFYIHRNMYPGEKDYGVSKERIIDKYQWIRG